MQNFKKDKLFHQSALQSLVPKNIYSVLQCHSNQIHDMTEMKRACMFQGSDINILTPQVQVPIQFDSSKFYLDDVKKEALQDSNNFINFNKRTEIHTKRRPIRNTYIFRGVNQLMRKNDVKRTFDENLQSFIFANCPHERGF